MDDIEKSDQQHQVHVNARIKAIREQKLDLSNPSRKCWSCGFETPSEKHRWCCRECTRAWEAEQ